MTKKFCSALSLFASLVAVSAIAADFTLPMLPKFDTEFKLSDHTGKTFYDFMKSDLKDKMNGKRQSAASNDLLKKGEGVSVNLNNRNYNIHVNYYNDPKSGRSYGWTEGLVGDWSDRAILDNTGRSRRASATGNSRISMPPLSRWSATATPRGSRS